MPSSNRPLAPGTITKLEAQQHDANRVSVFLDGDFAFGVHVDLVLEFDLHKGQSLSVEQQKKIVEADQVQKAKSRALNYIAYRPRTEREVRRKLYENEYNEAVVEQVVEQLRDLDYLDDVAYAREYARERFRVHGYGPYRIQSELKSRGVDRRWIEQALEELLEDEDMMEAARQHAEKRWPRVAGESNPFKRRQKLSDYLVRRGFSYDTVRTVVEEIEQRAAE